MVTPNYPRIRTAHTPSRSGSAAHTDATIARAGLHRSLFPDSLSEAVRLLRETTVLILVGYSLPEDGTALIRFILRQFGEEGEDGRDKFIFYISPGSDGQAHCVESGPSRYRLRWRPARDHLSRKLRRICRRMPAPCPQYRGLTRTNRAAPSPAVTARNRLAASRTAARLRSRAAEGFTIFSHTILKRNRPWLSRHREPPLGGVAIQAGGMGRPAWIATALRASR